MDIKFILLMIGIFFFTLGYVNQNKYNCNINPSLNNVQSQQLVDLFYDKNVLAERDPDNKIYDYKIDGTDYSKQEVGIGISQLKSLVSDRDSDSESSNYSHDI